MNLQLRNLGADDSDSHGLVWTAYRYISGTYTVEAFGVPWTAPNGITNAGSNNTGLVSACFPLTAPVTGAHAGVTTAGDTATGYFEVPQIATDPQLTSYRVYLHTDDTLNVIGNTTLPSDPASTSPCYELKTGFSSCLGVTVSLTNGSQRCSVNDLEHGININPYSSYTDAYGVLANGLLPTQVGTITEL